MGTGKLAKIQKNILFSVLAQLVTMAMGVIIPRITILEYGSSINGLLTSVSQIVAYLILFEAGIKQVAQQSLYKTLSTNNLKDSNAVISAVHKNYRRIGLYYLLGLLGMAAVYPLVVELDELNYISIFAVVLFSGFGNVVNFFFTGKYTILLESDGRAYVITNLNTVISILTHVFKIVLICLGQPIVYVVVVSFLVHVIQNVVVYLYVRAKYKWVDLSVDPNFQSLEQSGHALGHQLSTLVFRNTDVLLLTFFVDLKLVSVYAMFKLIMGYIHSIMLIPLNSCNFAMGQLYYSDRQKYTRFSETLEICYNTAVVAIFTVTYVLLIPFLRLYTAGITDVNYIDRVAAILFVSGEVLDLIRMPSLRTINYAKHFKETLPRSLIETAINLTVSIVGVIFLGLYGVLAGTVAALLYRTADIVFYAHTRLLDRSPKKTLIALFSNAVSAGLTVAVFHAINPTISNYGQFLIWGSALVIVVLPVFFGATYLVARPDISPMVAFIKRKLHK